MKQSLTTDLRANVIYNILEACERQGRETYVWVYVDKFVRVPSDAVIDQWVVLDISSDAVSDFEIRNGWVTFTADFGNLSGYIVAFPTERVARVAPRDAPSDGASFDLPREKSDYWATCPAPELFGRQARTENDGFEIV